MTPRTKQEQRGATLLSLFATPFALPLYFVERTWRADRRAPMTDVVMSIAQDLGIATVRTLGHITNARIKKLGLRYDTDS
ncbi:MAG: hypothetical protein U0350_15765 [Caldilineaceae bacterium]